MSFDDVAARMRSRHQPYDNSLGEPPTIPSSSADPIAYKLAVAAHQDHARRMVTMGVLLLGVGIGITALTHSMATDAGGGTYIVAYGPIAAGIIYLLKGLLSSPPSPR